ncbi:hypothetical protein CBF23_009750 [Marinomonas agarivorans]|nr:hypothetical protein CBF23_009750 [Marinomonas agarivorans]
MWIAISIVALFILYFIIKKKSDGTNTEETTLAQTATTLEKTATDDTTSTSTAETTEATPEKDKPTEDKAAAEPASKPAPKKAAKTTTSTVTTDTSEYTDQYNTLSNKFSSAKAFSLFDTQAAFFWNEGDNTVTLLSITAFVKGAAKSSTYGTYSFNVTDWVWSGDQPKGCATEIKKYLSESFKKGETA